MSLTLFTYISRHFAARFLTVLGLCAMVILLADTIELVRKAASRPEATTGVVLQMALLRLPHLADVAIPFAMLFGSMMAFWRLTRHQELVVARASGVSAWQFLLPAITVAFVIGVLKITTFNPIAATTFNKYELMDSKYFEDRPNTLTIAGSGLWLRDQSGSDHWIVHARQIAPIDKVLKEVMIIQFEDTDRFSIRIDARSARLADGAWLLSDAWITGADQTTEPHAELRIPTGLTWKKIEDSFASPNGMLIWNMPEFIKVLEEAGFSALKHKAYFHSALAAPFLLAAMVLIAAPFSLRPNRRTSMLALMVAGGVTGLVFFMLSEIFMRLGLSAQIPASLAAWAPTAIGWLLGVASLLHLEDG